MSVPTMEELVETFLAGHEKTRANLIATWQFKQDDPACVRAGLLAVLDRLKPVVTKAYANGALARTPMMIPAKMCELGDAYATRIIDQIKGA